MDFTQIGLFSIAYILGAIFCFWYRKKKMTQISFSSSVVGRLPLYWPICPFRNYVLAVFYLSPA